MRNEYYIARRLSSRRDGAKAGIMERVATVATTVSIAVIFITLSVVIGFKQELNNIVSNSVADIVVTSPVSQGVVSSVTIPRSASIEEILRCDDVQRVSPYTARSGVLKNENNLYGVLLKGVDSLYDFSFYAQHLVAGELPRIGAEPRSKDILISQSVARIMDVSVGDRVEMAFINDNGGVLRDRFSISGIFHTGVDIIDNGYLFTDMGNVARLYNGDIEAITGYELWLNPDANVEVTTAKLNEELLELYFTDDINAEAFSLQSLFRSVFGWLSTHNVNALIIIIIMIVVALLNMTTALLIIVLERQRMIGELRSMGMSRSSVVLVFFFRALNIMARAILWGAVIGVALTLIQYIWHIVPLPAEGYLLESVPVALCWGWWGLSIVGAIICAMGVLMLPASFAASISPATAMRYE